MPTPFPNSATAYPGPTQVRNHYGVAAKFDFDNPRKWVTVPSIPLLDEHEMTNESGQPVAQVDRAALEEIAANNNRRVIETGDPATAILGHTSDDPRAPEKPAKGFFVNYQVKPFKRDPKTGQVIYAIHGDLKVRPQNRSIVEEYPRRSVELWWGKKEIDPVALLGGTTPERDLSVVIRHARLYHVALLGGSTPARDVGVNVARYDRRSNGTIIEGEPLRYDHDKFGKVMSEFKAGTLHSGSRHGPKVTNPKQAKAIAASEAGISKHARGEEDGMGGMNGMSPHKCGGGQDASLNYADDEMSTDDAPPEDDGPPDDGGGDDFGGGEEDSGDDPAVAAVLQSKAFKSAIRDAVMEALTAIESEPPPGSGGDAGMPPGGGMDAPGGDPGIDIPGGEPPMGGPEAGPPGGGMGGMPPEEEAAEFHGERPVKFDDSMMYSDSAFPGGTNTFTPGFGGGKKPTAPGAKKMNRTPTPVRRAAPPQQQTEVIRLRRTVDVMARKLARADAERLIAACKQEGILFADENDEINRLAQLDEAGQKFMLDQYRKNYRRREADPAQPAYPGVARFARPVATEGGGAAGEDFEPQTPAEAQELANYIRKNKLPWDEGVKKFARERNGTTPRR